MRRTRKHQRGYVFLKDHYWYVRYREDVLQSDGTSKRIQKCHQLVACEGTYQKKEAVRVLADEFLAPFNNGSLRADSTMSLDQFIERHYLPFIKSRKKPSTHNGYSQVWKHKISGRGEIALRDFRTQEAERMLEEINEDHDLTSTTLSHIKAFLSGVMRYAKRQGVIPFENPVRDVVLPKGRPPGETYAYTLEEELQMLNVLPEPAAR
jgi:hypothetical protein